MPPEAGEEVKAALVMRTWLHGQSVDCGAEGFRVVLDGVQAHITCMGHEGRVKLRLPFLLAAQGPSEQGATPPAAAKKKAASRSTT